MPSRAPNLINRLPDIAILMMAAVIAISLSLIGRPDLAVLILLPLAVYLVLSWLKEYHGNKMTAGPKEQVAPETIQPEGEA